MKAHIVAPVDYGALTQKIYNKTNSYVKTKTIMKNQYNIDISLKEV